MSEAEYYNSKEYKRKNLKAELYHDNFQNYKRYNIPPAQLVIADIPYNTGNDAYASNPQWYEEGEIEKGQSDKAGEQFFNTDSSFNIAEYMHFCSKLLKDEPEDSGEAPAMIVFCAFEQIPMIKQYGKKYGFENSYPLFFIKNYSPQVLKANMRVVGATEHAVVLYREKLPKFNNNGKMVYNWMEWPKSDSAPNIHPTQKPIPLLKRLIRLFTDEWETVIDPVAGSGATLKAAAESNRNSYGFEVDRDFYKDANEKMLGEVQYRFSFN